MNKGFYWYYNFSKVKTEFQNICVKNKKTNEVGYCSESVWNDVISKCEDYIKI